MPKYDFVEVGTSDFETLIQEASEQSVGLCIEPIKLYLDRLPSRPHVKKLRRAISDRNDEVAIFYMPPEEIAARQLPEWLKGCNSIAKPHPSLVYQLTQRGLKPAELIKHDVVPMQTLYDCLLEHNVTALEFLKLDTEGHDCVILDKFAHDVTAHSRADLLPRRFQFESNTLTPPRTVQATIAQFERLGYRVASSGHDTVMERAPQPEPTTT
jgi:hypothetical protein